MAEIAPLSVFQKATAAVQYIRISLPPSLASPRVGIICGSGLGGLADTIHPQPKYEVAYADIPHFPVSTVQGHAGKLVFGLLGGKRTPVVLMVGRAHFYEGHTIEKITLPVRALKVLGIEATIVTNAAGGLNAGYAVGDVVVMNDHLNLAGLVGIHPLRGPNSDDFGVRFPALSDAYDLELRRMVHRAWRSLQLGQDGRRIHEGVYAFVGGPSRYETRAECRLLRSLGADLVGMSTVPEIIVARHSGLRVLALSLVTNIAVLDAGPRGDNVEIESIAGGDLNKAIEKGKANHEEVLAAGLEAAKDMQVLVKQCVDDMFTV
ncbi:MAG: hypothetical protein M1839_001219 [Geoglossum umbratile]|nr:MAG: hypothetical protein M1839_001219 [Geoglossum umbratile]